MQFKQKLNKNIIIKKHKKQNKKKTANCKYTLKLNKIEISDIVATFQRYEYIVRYFFGEEEYANELKENYNHLISYLNM